MSLLGSIEQKFGVTCVGLVMVAAPPAIVVRTELGLKVVGQGNGAGTPPLQTSGVARKIPFLRRGGLSNRMLFHIAFSKNNPAPPRTTVFPTPPTSHANPTWGAKL